MSKKEIRKNFRDSVFQRDRYSCVWCGRSVEPDKAEDELDAHHITDRNEMPNGGYVPQNGITLCKEPYNDCHLKAEQYHITKGQQWEDGMKPDDLYKLIGSSKKLAVQYSAKLPSMIEWKFPKYEVGADLDWDDLSKTYSWIADMHNVEQDHIWHAEGNVFIHTRMVTTALINLEEFQELSEQDKHILVTAALMHDIEKRSTTVIEVIDGVERITSPAHAKKGEHTAREILYTQMNTPFEIREQICKLVRYHGLPIWAISKGNPDREVIYASTQVNTKHLYMLAKADVLGRIATDDNDFAVRIELFKELCIENECFGQERSFKSNHGRFMYFTKDEAFVDFEPFDDTICEVTVMCAVPGSGKDHYIKSNLDIPMLSLDQIRIDHKLSPIDKKENGQAIQLGKEQAKVYLRQKQDFVFNATNITKDMRSKWIGLFLDYNAKVKIVYIEVPYNTLLKQNKNREYVVDEKAINNLIYKLDIPTYSEAHEVEYVINY